MAALEQTRPSRATVQGCQTTAHRQTPSQALVPIRIQTLILTPILTRMIRRVALMEEYLQKPKVVQIRCQMNHIEIA